jgi:predicted amidohydrolase YtcJ
MYKLKAIHIYFLLFIFLCISCSTEQKTADLIIKANNIQTVNANADRVNAVIVKDGIIVALGDSSIIADWKGTKTKILQISDGLVIPGLIEAHGHFSNLGRGQQNLNFLTSKSWKEIVEMVKEKTGEVQPGEWIYGRGWHQDKWNEKPENNVGTYPSHNTLSDISPENPTILFHASGHSLFANKKAMELAGISSETPDPNGGHIVRDANGNAIGVFEERAMNSIRSAYQEYLDKLPKEELDKKWHDGIKLATQECVSKGLTSFQDAGSHFYEIDNYKKLAVDGNLGIRLWAMLRHSSEDMKDVAGNYKMINEGNNFFTCRAIKTEVDGALGAYGAWLLEPYDDKPGFVGQNTTEISEVEAIADIALANDMQLCVHAIGDKANQEVLNIIERKVENRDHRWRIEHAQHLHPDDIPRFAKTGTIASMQAIHCTSDAPFVVTRLGEERARVGAYPWRSLIDSGAIIINGTDTPVEDVDPLISYYASVTRRNPAHDLAFFPEQAMTRMEALKSYTIDAAYGAFEEDLKGSIEVGKLADFTILDTDILQCDAEDILTTKVLYTIIDGEIVYKD